MVKLGGEYLTLTGVPSKDIIAIRDDIYKLREDLQYYLEHLDESNLTESFSKTIKDEVSGDVSMITQLADQISTRVSNIAGDVSALSQRADSITARVENAESDITTLEQTASGITTRVVAVEGDVTALDGRVGTAEGNITTLDGSISAVDQKADSISADVTNLDGRFSTFKQNVDGWAFKIGDGTAEKNISINNGIVDLRDFDVTAKTLKTVSDDLVAGTRDSVEIDSGKQDFYHSNYNGSTESNKQLQMRLGTAPGSDYNLSIYGENKNGTYGKIGSLGRLDTLFDGHEVVLGSFNSDLFLNASGANIALQGNSITINGIPYNNVFCAYRNTNRAITPGGDTVIGFNAVLHDIGNLFYLEDGHIVCTMDGKVEISGQVDTSISGANGKEAYTYLYKNGLAIDVATRVTISSGMTTALCTPRIISVSAGDTLSPTIHIPVGSTGTIYQGAYRTFYTFRYIN